MCFLLANDFDKKSISYFISLAKLFFYDKVKKNFNHKNNQNKGFILLVINLIRPNHIIKI